MAGVVIGGRMRLHLPMSHSLKDKRQVVRSLQQRLRDTFGVSVAETGDHDLWQAAELTIAYAARDAAQARATLEKIADFVDTFHLPVVLAEAESDLIAF